MNCIRSTAVVYLTIGWLLLCSNTVWAQYDLYLSNATGDPGSSADIQVLLDNNGDDIQGWSFGVCHDGLSLSLTAVVDGATTSTVKNGAPPDFNQVNVISTQGFTVGVVVCFTGCAVLPSATTGNELNVATYVLIGANGSSTSVDFCATLGNPPMEILVVVGGQSFLPSTSSGTVSIADCDVAPDAPTSLSCSIAQNNCQCAATLEWDAPSGPISDIEIWVEGNLVNIVPATTQSATISLPQSGSNGVCIRSRCGDLFSQFVCCTVVCDVDDCNNNGVPDFCDLAQGALDCNDNGALDECEIASGASPDCNGNNIPDECEYSTAADCNSNGVLDECDILIGISQDCNTNTIPDECEIAGGTAADCNSNGIPDTCDYSSETDCNSNGLIDQCDILLGVSEDCDENEVPDECDIAAGAPDTDGDGIPDICAGQNFIRGECNGDDSITIADAIFLLGFLFNSGPAPTCQDACDINDDSGIDIGGGVYLLAYLFSAGPNPQNPFPTCGPDPTEDLLGCESFGGCP